MVISTAWLAVYIAMAASIVAIVYGILEQKRIEAAAANRSFAGLGESLMKIKPDPGLDAGSGSSVESGKGVPSLREIPIVRAGEQASGPRFDIEKAFVFQPGFLPAAGSRGAPMPEDYPAVHLRKWARTDPEWARLHMGEGMFGVLDEKGEIHPLPYSGPIVYGRIVDDPSDQSSS